MDDQDARVLKYCWDLCNKYSATLTFHPGKLIPGLSEADGAFRWSDRLIEVGRDNPDWSYVLLHEVMHLCQCAEGTQVFNEAYGSNEIEAWLKGKRLWDRTVRKMIWNTARLEMDCEARVIKALSELNIPASEVEAYTLLANMYVLKHGCIYRYRQWPVSNPVSDDASQEEYSKYYGDIKTDGLYEFNNLDELLAVSDKRHWKLEGAP